MISTTRNSSYQTLVTSVRPKSILSTFLRSGIAGETVHIVSTNGVNICTHTEDTCLNISAISLIQKDDKPAVCKCNKQLRGKVDLRFKPDKAKRKYVDCMTYSKSELLSSHLHLEGLTYRLRRPHCAECKHPKQLPKGNRLSWKLVLELGNPRTGVKLRGTQTIKCFVDTSTHTSAFVPISFNRLVSPTDAPPAPERKTPHPDPFLPSLQSTLSAKLPSSRLSTSEFGLFSGIYEVPATPLDSLRLEEIELPELPSHFRVEEPPKTTTPQYLDSLLDSLLAFEPDLPASG